MGQRDGTRRIVRCSPASASLLAPCAVCLCYVCVMGALCSPLRDASAPRPPLKGLSAPGSPHRAPPFLLLFPRIHFFIERRSRAPLPSLRLHVGSSLVLLFKPSRAEPHSPAPPPSPSPPAGPAHLQFLPPPPPCGAGPPRGVPVPGGQRGAAPTAAGEPGNAEEQRLRRSAIGERKRLIEPGASAMG